MKHEPDIHKNVNGFKRMPRAIYCSVKGFKAAWVYESGFRQYAVVSVLLFPLSFFVATSSVQWLLLVGSLVFVLFAEIVNSAIEAVADATIPEYNELIGRAKDLGSAGVLTALLFCALVWCVAILACF